MGWRLFLFRMSGTFSGFDVALAKRFGAENVGSVDGV